jgi:hypothetical protein
MRQNDTKISIFHHRNCLLGLSILIVLMFSQCSKPQGPEFEDYYFPLEQVEEGLIYKYEMSGPMAAEYWYLKSFEEEDSIILTLTVYDAQQRQQQLSRERKYPSGWVQRNLFFYTYDSMGMERIEAEIIQDDLYPFHVKDSLDVTLYAATWPTEVDGEKVTNKLFRNRRWVGKDTLSIMGRRIPSLVFRVYDWIEDERKGTLRIKMESNEYYGLNWGLVKKEQYIDGELFRSFHLADTINMETFEAMYKAQSE